MKLKKTIIVAMTKDRLIGKNNDLPWRISEDLKLFKRLTLKNTVIMGRKTYDSIGKPLPKRNNIVLSKTMESTEKITVCPDVNEAIEKAEEFERDIFVIGGANIYEQVFSKATHLSISWVKKDYDGDTYFPDFNLDEWEVVESTDYSDFEHVIYKRKN